MSVRWRTFASATRTMRLYSQNAGAALKALSAPLRPRRALWSRRLLQRIKAAAEIAGPGRLSVSRCRARWRATTASFIQPSISSAFSHRVRYFLTAGGRNRPERLSTSQHSFLSDLRKLCRSSSESRPTCRALLLALDCTRFSKEGASDRRRFPIRSPPSKSGRAAPASTQHARPSTSAVNS